MGGGTTKKSDAKNGKKILEPGELDVLCGRGGMSNHHPGNEWYRRLIKSNRPLYRACPKHTKLLVSKAIVQAVEQQGGRFLEKNRDDGSWYEVTYKRAVDKTSQGLRERERDDETPATASSPGTAATTPRVTLPDEFSGRTRGTPNLSDLADVAIAHAHKTDGLPRKASDLVTAPTGVAASVAKATGASLSAVQPSSSAAQKAQRHAAPQVPAQVQQQAQQPASSVLKKRPLPVHQQQQARPLHKRAKQEGGGEEDFAPLPPNLQKRESSMFRMLKQTKLLLQQSESWQTQPATAAAASTIPQQAAAPNVHMLPPHMMGMAAPATAASVAPKSKYPTKLNNLATTSTAAAAAANTETTGTNPNAVAAVAPRGKGARQLDRMSLSQQQPQLSPSPLMAGTTQFVTAPLAAPPPPAQAGGAPALTRLTSQVSDWLTSFFPVATRGESVAAAGPLGGSMAWRPPTTTNAAAVATASRQQQQQQQQQEMEAKIVTLPPPKTWEAPQINTIPPMKKNRTSLEDDDDDEEDAALHAQQPQQQQPTSPSNNYSKRSSKRKSQSNMPPLPFDATRQQLQLQQQVSAGPLGMGVPVMGGAPGGASHPGANGGGDMFMPPAPTELEQSVSATLLKLAGTPSKLYSGLSSFFGKSAAPPPAAAARAPAPPVPEGALLGGTKRSSAPLLDDDDDEEEDRAAAAAAAMQPQQQQKRSLLDDHEETPMEQRMRAAVWTNAAAAKNGMPV